MGDLSSLSTKLLSYFTVSLHLCLWVRWCKVEVLAGLRLSGLMPGIGSIPPRQSPVLRSRAASVESLQQDMNYGCNEKSQPSAQREYAKCRAITSMQCPSLALRCLWVRDAPKIVLSSNLRLPHPKDTTRPSPRVLQGRKLGNSSFEKHPPVLCEVCLWKHRGH